MFVFGRAARQATPGVPGRFLGLHRDRATSSSTTWSARSTTATAGSSVALSLSLFTWIIAMNAMDLLPLDLPANIAGATGNEHAYWRILPTADLKGTLALALVVLRADHLLFHQAPRASVVTATSGCRRRSASGCSPSTSS